MYPPGLLALSSINASCAMTAVWKSASLCVAFSIGSLGCLRFCRFGVVEEHGAEDCRHADKEAAGAVPCDEFGCELAAGYVSLLLAGLLAPTCGFLELGGRLPVEARRVWGCCHLHFGYMFFS